jgi:hypothetical protein
MDVPFFSPLIRLKPTSHKKAVKEVSISALLSTLPIWLGGLLTGMLAKAKCPQDGFFSNAATGMKEFVSQGELYMLAVATLAPIFYLTASLQNGPTKPSGSGFDSRMWPFPQLDSHRFFVALFITVASVVFFYMRSEHVANTNYVVSVSLVFYALSLLVIYAASANSEERTSFQGFPESAKDEEDFIADYSSHRGDDA